MNVSPLAYCWSRVSWCCTRCYSSFGRLALGVYKLSQSMKGGRGRWGKTNICLLSTFLLFRTRYVRYFMAIWCMFFMRVVMMDFGICRLTSLLMECSCIAPIAPAMMVMRGLVCHPRFCMVLISESYLVCLCVRVCLGNLSWQYVPRSYKTYPSWHYWWNMFMGPALGPVYTMDHEVGPWKVVFSMARLDCPISMVWLLKKLIYKAFGLHTTCKLNVDQE